MLYRDKGVGNRIAQTGEEVGDSKHHEDPALQKAPHVN